MKIRKITRLIFLLTLMQIPVLSTQSQVATITETMEKFKTYPYSDPDPVAKFTKHYPYYRFDGFAVEPKEQEWKIVTLENDYIKVYVAPQMGGKILGAIDKATGEEFIYFNKVVKFRDIAMRGAWTSGGIELNFGSIGHAPTTASPVNYLLQKNKDGSVSCFVGAPDITSRTEWRVEIRLPADASYFETNAIWYNPSELKTSLYNWMTASVDATNDLQYYFPGHTEIGHGGEAGSWPVNEKGVNISMYKNNDFGGSKSYHVLGEYAEHFLCYFRDKEFGLGHLSAYDEKPGQKIWIWALSREGGIWEDLLTDPGNTQYTEIQTGILFNQAGDGSTFSPFKHLFFDEGSEQKFSELWFPVKGIGGMVKANEYGSLNVENIDGKVKVGFCANREISGELILRNNNKAFIRKNIHLKPGEFIVEYADAPLDKNLEVSIGDFFDFKNEELEERKLSKPVTITRDFDWDSEQGMVTKAIELEKQRLYTEAHKSFEKILEKNPANLDALIHLAGLEYRRMNYEDANKFALKALSIDTYNPEANYVFGLISKKLNKKYDALDGFSVAARSVSYRSVANMELASIYFKDGDMQKCLKYAEKSLDYDRYSINALKIKALALEKMDQSGKKEEVLDEILKIDPLNTFARFEKNDDFQVVLNYEMPNEICIEQALSYVELGLKDKAVSLLKATTPTPIINFWLAYLLNDKTYLEKALSASPYLVYPSRSETADVLTWAKQQENDWKTDYYLGLIYASKDRKEDAERLFEKCGSEPDYFGFYLARYEMLNGKTGYNGETDLLKAMELAPDSWRCYRALTEFYRENEQFDKSLDWAQKGLSRFPESYVLAYHNAVSNLISNNPEKALNILTTTTILPNEGASYGRTVYRQACLLNAVSFLEKNNTRKALDMVQKARLWPENLGVGKPYITDERIEDYLELLYWQKRKNQDKVKELQEKIIGASLNSERHNSGDYLAALLLKNSGRENEAKNLLFDWSAKNPENKIAAWSMAKINQNDSDAKKILNDIMVESGGTLFNPKVRDNGFGLVYAISELE